MQHELTLLKTQEHSLLQFADNENDLFVIGMKGLQYLQLRGLHQEILQPLNSIAQWSKEFLCNPHAELGRKGAVCPFTKPSIDKELFWLSMYDKSASSPEEIYQVMVKYKNLFLELPPKEGKDVQYKTILVVFPQIKQQDCRLFIDDVQEQLKAQFVAQGLMIGQFHAQCQQSGLWNPDFRPLQSPLPMLVIRNMVVSDYPFLEHDHSMVQSWSSLFPVSSTNYLQKYKKVS